MKHLKHMALVPGLPHILQLSHKNAGYLALNEAVQALGERFAEAGVERFFYVSSSWLAVLDQMFQAKERLQGSHVDENWYAYGPLSYDLRIDTKFAQKAATAVQGTGRKTRLVDFEGFPLDTGTIVADRLLNVANKPVCIMANNVYTDYQGMRELGLALKSAFAADGVATALILVSGMSGRFHTTPVDVREDFFAETGDDLWNQKIIDHLAAGKISEVETMIPEFGQQTKAEMGFKCFGVLAGILNSEGQQWTVTKEAYAPVYGTGCAVLSMCLDEG